MGSFYRQLIIDHQPANALHNAKLQWLQQKGGQQFQKLPYFWAGMVYSGDNRAVVMKQKNTSSKLWWITAIIAAGILLLFFKRSKVLRR